MTPIIHFFVKNKHFTLIATIGCLLFGILSVLSMRIQLNPDVQFPTITLKIDYPQANQESIRKNVIDPLLPLLRKNDRILASQFEIKDQVAEGRFTFSINDDLDKEFWSLNQMLEKVSQSLPDQVYFSLNKEQLSQVISPFVIAVTSQDPDQKKRELHQLKQQLLLIPDVTGIRQLGNTTSLWITLDSEKILKQQLSYHQIVSQIQKKTTSIIQGTTTIGELIIPVSFKTKLNSEETLKNETFYPLQGNPVTLEKVASFEKKEDKPILISTLNDKSTALMTVQLSDNANILSASQQIKDLISTIPNSELLYDEAVEIRYHLRQLVINLIQGLLVLFLALFLLLGFRYGLIISILLPATVLFVIGFLNFLDLPLQQVSIAGLVIALGLLIDNAIVVAESCMKKGHSTAKDTSQIQAYYIRQTAQVSRPLIFSTLTTVLAFLPIYFLKTEAGLFLKSVALAVTVTLIISIISALTIIPFFLSMYKKTSDKVPWGHRQLIKLRDRFYLPLITQKIRSKRIATGIILVSIIVSGLLIRLIPFQLFPPAQDQFGYVTINRYVGDTEAVFRQKVETVSKKIKANIPTQFVVKTVGMRFPRVNYSMPSQSNDGDIAQLFFKINDHRSTKHHYIAKLKSILMELPFSDSIGIQEFMFNQSQQFPLTIQVSGQSKRELNAVEQHLQQWVQQHPDILGALSSNEDHHLDLNYQVDVDKIIANELSTEEVQLAVQLAVTGKYLMTIYDEYQQRVPVMMEVSQSLSTPVQERLSNILIVNHKGRSFLLSELVSFKLYSQPKSSWVLNDQLTFQLTLQLKDNADIATLVNQLNHQQKMLEQDYAIKMQFNSAEKKIRDNFSQFTLISLFFIVLIFSILVVVFQSFKLPLIIFTVLPVSFMGGLIALACTNQVLSLFAYLGFVSLAGIVINDSILLIDQFEKVKKETYFSTSMQLIESAKIRFIPVSTTSITTLLSILPLAVVQSLFQPLAIVLIGGVCVSTVVILLTVPILVHWSES